jgi:hypothetical protein
MKKSTKAGVGPGWTDTGFRRKAKRNSNRGVIGTLLVGFAAVVLWLCSLLGKTAECLTRLLLPKIVHATVYVATLAAIVLAVAHYGSIGLDRGLTFAHAKVGEAHRETMSAIDRLWALVPRLEPERPAPRAVPVREDVPKGAEPSSAIEQVAAFVEESLFPSGYPRPHGQPAIEGSILAKAGGDRIQALITETLPAIRQVESSGQMFCVGDDGLAFGMYQVRREPCEDIRNFFGVDIDPKDCDGNAKLSEYALRLYLGYWAAHFEKSTKGAATAEMLCRTWNGGPDQGPRSKTDIYWERCQKHLPEIAQLAAR